METWTRRQIADRLSAILKDIWIDWTFDDGGHCHLFDELGFDSLDEFHVVARLMEEFRFEADNGDFVRIFTIGGLLEVVYRKLAASGTLVD